MYPYTWKNAHTLEKMEKEEFQLRVFPQKGRNGPKTHMEMRMNPNSQSWKRRKSEISLPLSSHKATAIKLMALVWTQTFMLNLCPPPACLKWPLTSNYIIPNPQPFTGPGHHRSLSCFLCLSLSLCPVSLTCSCSEMVFHTSPLNISVRSVACCDLWVPTHKVLLPINPSNTGQGNQVWSTVSLVVHTRNPSPPGPETGGSRVQN